MLRLSVENKEYLMVGDNVKIIFLGGSGNHHRIMIDAPKDVNIVRSKALKKHMKENGIECEFPSYYEEKEHPENKNLEAVFASTVRKATVFMDKQQSGLRISAWLW